MGRMPVDVREILSLAWDHPVIAGVFMLMFTPPFFPVLVFFSPLLIFTTLCAVASIDVGHTIEDVAKREREITGWNARVIDGDVLSARERTIRRRRVPGEDNWLDWVRGFEPGSVWQQNESMFLEDVKEERLMSEFRIDEGGIEMVEEEFRQQIEAFREFERNLGSENKTSFGERSFSFRTGARVAAAALESSPPSPTTTPVHDSFMKMVPYQHQQRESPSPPPASGAGNPPQMPSMFLYTLATGGTGSGNFNELAPPKQRAAHRRQTHQQQQPPQQQQQGGGPVSFGSGFISGSFEDPSESGKHDHNHSQQRYRQDQQQQKRSSLGVDDTAAPEIHVSSATKYPPTSPSRSPSRSIMSGSVVERGREVSLSEGKTASFNFGREDKSYQGGNNLPEQQHPKSRGTMTGERFKTLTYNASLLPGNAVIYTAESPPLLQRKYSNRERRESSTTTTSQKRKHGSREKSPRHLFQLDSNISGDWMEMMTSTAR